MPKVSQDPRAVAERLRLALDLMEAGTALVRQKFALVGGLAVSARAEPRLTRDLDLAVVAERLL